MQVLAVVITLCIMFATVASLVNFAVPRSSLDPIEEELMRRVENQLDVWYDSELAPSSVCAPKSELEKLVHDGIDDKHDAWNLTTSRYGPGYDVDLVMYNGRHNYPLHGSGKVVGSSFAHPWIPDQYYALPTIHSTRLSGLEKGVIDVPGISWVGMALLRGEAVRISTSYTGVQGTAVSEVWSPTALLPLASTTRTSASTIIWGVADEPVLQIQLLPKQVAGDGNQVVRLEIEITGIGGPDSVSSIPIGTEIAIDLPRDWREGTLILPDGWIDSSTGTSLHARLNSGDSTSAKLGITALAPTNPTRPFDIIRAKLSNSSLGESNLVVTYPTSVERGLPRVFAPTTPYPVRPGETTWFGGAFANGGDQVTVTDVDIAIPGGYDATHNQGKGAPLFGSVNNDDSIPPGGWSVSPDHKHLKWHDSTGITVAQSGAATFAAKVTINDDAALTTAIEPAGSDGPNATISFSNGYKATSDEWGKSPGVIEFRVPPASRAEDDPAGGTSDGYPWSTSGAASGETQLVNATVRSPLAALRNWTSYSVSSQGADAVSFESATANASLEVMTRQAPVGSNVKVNGNLESLMQQLNTLHVSSKLVLDMYAPPSLGCAPTRSWEIPSSSLPGSGVVAATAWTPGEEPILFAGTNDGVVHRIDSTTGHDVWSIATSGTPTALEMMDRGGGDGYVLVGTSNGHVQAIRASDGQMMWTVSTSTSTSATTKATVVRYDAAHERILAGDDLGDLAVFTPSGDPLPPPALGAGAIVDIKATSEDVYVLAATEFLQLSASDLTTLNERPDAGLGFALGAHYILLADANKVAFLDPSTFEVTGAITLTESAEQGARGDATGDGIEDLVVVDGARKISIIDGNDLHVVERVLDPPPVAATKLANIVDDGLPISQHCTPTTNTYQAELMCGHLLGGGALVMLAANGRTTITDPYEAGYRIDQLDGAGNIVWAASSDTQHTPQALAPATWLAGTSAVLVGDSNGGLSAYTSTSTPVMTSTPSDRLGHFTFAMHVPEGGFFGPHLLVARLQWWIGGQAQEARLLDWFDVVGDDGAPVEHASYDIGLTLSRRDGS